MGNSYSDNLICSIPIFIKKEVFVIAKKQKKGVKKKAPKRAVKKTAKKAVAAQKPVEVKKQDSAWKVIIWVIIIILLIYIISRLFG